MTDQGTTTQRGTGFPGLALDDAVAVVKEAGRYGKSHPAAAFAGYLGHSTPNSGPFRSKMAALRDFGLIERPKNGQVPLTSLAQNIAHPTGDERALLRQAFLHAEPFAVIYEESAKGTDLSLDLIANRAVTALGVSPQNKGRFAESFRRSVVAAGLGAAGADGMIRLVPADDGAGTSQDGPVDQQVAEADLAAATNKPGAGKAGTDVDPVRGGHVSAGRTPIIHQEWRVPGGHVLFEVALNGPLQGSAFGEIAGVITAVENFVLSLGSVLQADSQSETPEQEAPKTEGSDQRMG